METVSRCVLAVYTSYQLYVTVWTRERPPVRVRCAICKKRLTSAHLGLDAGLFVRSPVAGVGGPRVIFNDHFTQFLMREVQRDHWEGSKPPRVTPRSCADRTSDRGQVGRSATQRRAGENPRFRSSRNPLDSILVLDISGRVPDPGTMLGGRELLHKQILIYYIVLTRRKQLKSHLDTPHAHGWEVKYITIHAST